MNHWRKTLCLILLYALGADFGYGGKQSKERRHWEETATETLWREKYANCDYGFYVILPHGVVGHGSHSPNPNHGFLVALPDAGRAAAASLEDPRFLRVSAEYDSLELQSASTWADWLLDEMARHHSGFRQVVRGPAQLNNRPAIRIKAEYDGPRGRVVEEQIVALRRGILYQVDLVTTSEDYLADNDQFNRLWLDFRYWRIHYC